MAQRHAPHCNLHVGVLKVKSLTLAFTRWKRRLFTLYWASYLIVVFLWVSEESFSVPFIFPLCQELVNLFARQSMIFPRLWSKKRTSRDLREKEDRWPSWQGQDGRSRNVALLSGRQLVVFMLWMVLEFRFTWNVQYLGFSLSAKNTKHLQSNQKIWIN